MHKLKPNISLDVSPDIENGDIAELNEWIRPNPPGKRSKTNATLAPSVSSTSRERENSKWSSATHFARRFRDDPDIVHSGLKHLGERPARIVEVERWTRRYRALAN